MSGFDPDFLRQQRELAGYTDGVARFEKVEELRALVASADLVADVDSCEPEIIVAPRFGSVTLEALEYAFRSLGIEELLEPMWSGVDRPRAVWLTAEASAERAETAAAILRDWLRDHGVPKLHLWVPSRVAQDFVSIEWTASS